MQYQLSLAHRLGYIGDEQDRSLSDSCRQTTKVLNALICSLRQPVSEVRNLKSEA
jgi:hypothetical protein